MVYSPLKSLSFHINETYDKYVDHLAAKYNKTKEQIVLKFHIQRGTVPIPKSTHASRLIANYNIFDFEISNQEMNILLSFNMDYQYMAESMRCPGL
jgi:diketogulonate reductase-like aldo/keto reductase